MAQSTKGIKPGILTSFVAKKEDVPAKKERPLSEVMISSLIASANEKSKLQLVADLLRANGVKGSISTLNASRVKVTSHTGIVKSFSYNEIFFNPENVIKYIKRKMV